MLEIIIGVFASLIATILWIFFTSLYSFRSKRKIAILLELLYDSIDSFDTAIEFSQTSLAEIQCDRVIDCCIKIFDEIKPLTYFGAKKKLFYSILYNLYYTVTYYRRITVGYDGETESAQKLKKFRRKYYYKVNLCYKSEYADERNFASVSVCTLQSLNKFFTVKNALSSTLYINSNSTRKKETYLGLVHDMNLRSSRKRKYDISENCFTPEQYKAYITKIFKREE